MSDYGQSQSLYNGIEDYEKDVHREVVADFNIALLDDTCELKGTFSFPMDDEVGVVFINDDEWKECWLDGEIVFKAQKTWLDNCSFLIEYQGDRYAGGRLLEYIKIIYVRENIFGIQRTYVVLDSETGEDISFDEKGDRNHKDEFVELTKLVP